ncbi:hypothetical protein I352_04920 [Cryptococcus deuterogattii MMRL2647]|nr:hypothetical protein I352_04920 [Cryptococcus deuterogattii MMRL2647]
MLDISSVRTEINVFSFELSIILLVIQNLVYTPTLVIHTGKRATFTLNWDHLHR